MRRASGGDGALHAWAAAGVVVLVGVVGGGGYYANAGGGGGDAPKRPPLGELEAIEATLAMKSEEPPKKIPDKKKQAPPPEVEPDGASRDPDRPVEDKEPKKDPPKPAPKDLDEEMRKLREQRLQNDDDADYGKPTPEQGAFDGSQYGWAAESKGDPYFQKLVGDLLSCWTYPKGLAEEGEPVGCMRLELDGRVSDTLFRSKSGNGDLDQSVSRALDELKALRNDKPVPVPSHLIPHTRKWICFKFIVRE